MRVFIQLPPTAKLYRGEFLSRCTISWTVEAMKTFHGIQFIQMIASFSTYYTEGDIVMHNYWRN